MTINESASVELANELAALSPDSPRTEAVIVAAMKKYDGRGAASQCRYYEAVHQELAPLCRQLEKELAKANESMREMWSRRAAASSVETVGAVPVASPATMRDWLAMIHDNGYALGDRLQRLSCRIQSLLAGDAENRYLPHSIREQSVEPQLQQGVPILPIGSVLTSGAILAAERRSAMSDDETLRFGRATESMTLAGTPPTGINAESVLGELVGYQVRQKGDEWPAGVFEPGVVRISDEFERRALWAGPVGSIGRKLP